MNLLENYDRMEIVHALATMVGAFSVFPEVPDVLKNFTKNEAVKWILVFVLVWQGGGRKNIRLAVVLTIATYILFKVLKMYKQ